jgi:6-phosphogluconolactonase
MTSLHALAALALAVILASSAFAAAPTPTARAAAPAAAPTGSTAMGSAAASVPIYVGTYTGKSKGIYMLKMDPATGALSEPELAAETPNPSFLAFDATGKFAYAVNESGQGAVIAFAVEPDTGKLRQLNQQPSGGGAPCHILVDPAGTHVLVANYGSGTASVIALGKDGQLGKTDGSIQHQGAGPNKPRQDGPHAHCLGFDPTGKFVLVADLGLDAIMVYHYAATGRPTPNNPVGGFAIERGSGPRHFVFAPSGKFVYVVNELISSVGVYAWNADKGTLTGVQSMPSLAKGSAAEIAVHPNGKFVYASVRGPNVIAIFAADAATGKLAPVGTVPTQGGGPRHFAIDPSGRFLIVANQDAGNLVVFKIDPATGKLTPTGSKVEVPAAVCVAFQPVGK